MWSSGSSASFTVQSGTGLRAQEVSMNQNVRGCIALLEQFPFYSFCVFQTGSRAGLKLAMYGSGGTCYVEPWRMIWNLLCRAVEGNMVLAVYGSGG